MKDTENEYAPEAMKALRNHYDPASATALGLIAIAKELQYIRETLDVIAMRMQ